MRSDESGGDSPLELIVHDRDSNELLRRVKRLEQWLPDAQIAAFSTRGALLDHIGALPVHEPGERWPLALIDLVDARRTAPGERLFQTIEEHPDLRDRVAPVAFTRYGHDGREEVLQALGVRAILSPEVLNSEAQHLDGAKESLQLLAAGSDKLIRIGELPADEEDLRLIARMSELFPSLAEEYEQGSLEQWERAMWIVLVCRLFSEGYPQTSVLEQLGIKRGPVERLRRELEANWRKAIDRPFPAGGETTDLGVVIEELEPYLGRSKAIWEIIPPLEKLDGAARLRSLADDVEDLFSADPEQPVDLPRGMKLWVPPEYLQWLRYFIAAYLKLRAGHKGDATPHVEEAIELIAKRFGEPPARVRHGVAHAVMCLEDAVAERRSGAA